MLMYIISLHMWGYPRSCSYGRRGLSIIQLVAFIVHMVCGQSYSPHELCKLKV